MAPSVIYAESLYHCSINNPLITDGSIWNVTENNHQWQSRWKLTHIDAIISECSIIFSGSVLLRPLAPGWMQKYDGRSSCDPHLEPHSGLCSTELLLAPGFSPANQINLAWQTTRPQVLACSRCCSTLAGLCLTKKHSWNCVMSCWQPQYFAEFCKLFTFRPVVQFTLN